VSIIGAVIDTGLQAYLDDGSLERKAPYFAKVIGIVDNGKRYWNHLKIGIFERAEERQIGEYTYNYSSPHRTFHPFELRGKWYALYSKDYTATRLMSLPDCKDIGGEEGDGCGFCPVEYWVPPLTDLRMWHTDPKCPRFVDNYIDKDYTMGCKCDHKLYPYGQQWVMPERVHGFIAGCHWGDDSSWKIQYLDLSRADEGIFKREERFGYIQLPNHLTLDKAIELDVSEGGVFLQIATEDCYDIKTGKRL
jgi:hypothetical protein